MGFEAILPFSLAPGLFVGQIVSVLILLILCTLYPLARIYKLKLADALKGNL